MLGKKTVKRGALILALLLYAVGATLLLGTACPLRLVTGYPCPACGMTRAHLLFFTGHIGDAFSMQPLFPLTVVVAAMLLLTAVRPQLAKSKGYTLLCVLLIAALLSVFLVRMILYYPDKEPLSYYENNLIAFLRRIFGW